jgi:hypothetical protein
VADAVAQQFAEQYAGVIQQLRETLLDVVLHE